LFYILINVLWFGKWGRGVKAVYKLNKSKRSRLRNLVEVKVDEFGVL
jgi:hypothetical protein